MTDTPDAAEQDRALCEALEANAEDYTGPLQCDAAARIRALSEQLAHAKADADRLAKALEAIKIEAVRENGNWVHFKRLIHTQARHALSHHNGE